MTDTKKGIENPPHELARNQAQEAAEKIKSLAKEIKVTPEYLRTIMNTVAKGAPIEVFMMLMRVAKSTDLDPLRKEIWCYPLGGKYNIMTSRDGFLTLANRSNQFKGMNSAAVYDKDEFEVEYGDAVKIKHKILTLKKADRGTIVGAWAQVWREGNNQPTTVVVEWGQYNKGQNTWTTNPDAMIIKCAEAIALKKTFGVSGLESAEEMGVDMVTEEAKKPETALFDTIIKTIEGVKDGKKRIEVVQREIAENKALTDEQREQLKKYLPIDGEVKQ
jgi:phage recombination protein Bet